jgi:hypothetical protein
VLAEMIRWSVKVDGICIGKDDSGHSWWDGANVYRGYRCPKCNLFLAGILKRTDIGKPGKCPHCDLEEPRKRRVKWEQK